ncbi:MAG TPA: OsmC family peroxiredoxin [Candidatus Polarisedimenticolaceae bacterium]|nr:OsmC family peroxiredoxin [Candidatus Polarisedimenticolaceae bacterium]
MKRWATATWQGDLKNGQGKISTESGALEDAPYAFTSRFENGKGTNPEELIGAAHAGCFAMALAAALARAGHPATILSARATVQLDRQGEQWTITRSELALEADVPGIDRTEFDKIAAETKQSCPVSRVLRAEISLDARLAS